ncbi:MAG: hypothetical protein HC847_27055 [Hydrococcus sp. RU_2_2]|nr:hypothetical protein [Hydrococcus sp. RU_2_2]
MLVVIINDRIFPPQQVCQACLLADGNGQPRWRQGKLGCGRLVRSIDCCSEPQPDAYQCQMGFRLMEVE